MEKDKLKNIYKELHQKPETLDAKIMQQIQLQVTTKDKPLIHWGTLSLYILSLLTVVAICVYILEINIFVFVITLAFSLPLFVEKLILQN